MTTKHNHNPNFGRKVAGCPRCEEIKQGAAPVQGWGSAKRENERRFTEALAKHNCKERGCGPVCTFGDY